MPRRTINGYELSSTHFLERKLTAFPLQVQDAHREQDITEAPPTPDSIVSVLDFLTEPGNSEEEQEPLDVVAWQTYPLTPPLPPYNWNIYANIEGNAFFDLLETAQIYMTTPIADGPAVTAWMRILLDALSPDDDLPEEERPSPEEPLTTFIHPIVVNGTEVVATLSFSLLWRDLLANQLPTGSPPVNVVTNLCGRVYTFQVRGSKVYGLGTGDRHDRQFDKFGDSFLLRTNPMDAELPVNEDSCPTELFIYPTSEFIGRYTSKLPGILAGVVISIFLLTSLTFLVYDKCVERRQRLVGLEASKNATNEELLEEKVQERSAALEDMNRELEHANKHIQHASEAQLRHFACMSHEIRTPLNCIMGCSSLLIATPLEDIQRDSVEMISSSGEELLTVVNDVLEYSRLENGNVEFEMLEAQLQGIIDDSVWPVFAKSKDVKVVTHFDVATPEYIQTDCRRLKEVFTKLMQNAVSRSAVGDTVLFGLRVDLLESNLIACIQDQGPSISKDDCANIHKPFLKDGTANGLGLAISANIVLHMGGSVKAFSEEGQGARFLVKLPMGSDMNRELQERFEKLRDTQLIMCTNQSSQNTYVKSVAQHFQIPITCVSNQSSAIAVDAELEHDSQQRIVLIQGDLFNTRQWKHSKLRRIMTFGPNSSGNSSHTFVNIQEQLPTTIMHSLVTLLESPDRILPSKSARVAEEDIDIPYASLRLLIAEDNLVNQKVLARLLKRLGAQNVSIVSNGQQAVDKEAEQEFDFVFMDMQMPVMDGLEATRCIQERTQGHERARIIFVTAHALLDFQGQCFKAGGIEFVAKPCSMDSIDQCFKRIYVRDRFLGRG